MDDLKYCICCGEDVPYHAIERNERQEIICSNCGFPLEVTEAWGELEVPDYVAFVAEDSPSVREIIVNMLERKGFVKRVISCKDGSELLKEFTSIYKKIIETRKNITMGFAIIDLNMPNMDGITAARSIRSLEEKYKINKTPFIFFSSIIANDKIRSMLKTLAPAVYVNKGTSPDTVSLTQRVDALLKYVGEKYLTENS